MNKMKNEIELRLVGSLLSDWCRQKADSCDRFCYQSGWDSTHRIIRFATARLQGLFSLPENHKGRWENGMAVMYEIRNAASGVTLACTASPSGLRKREQKRMERLASACGAKLQNGLYLLAEWNISEEAESVNALMAVLDQMLDCELAWFETELTVWKNDPKHSIRAFPQISQELLCSSELPDEVYIEGAQKSILLNRYERSSKARARCIALQGSACKVCGFDFGIVFGEAFSGKIEVHHIKPISEIGEEYVVDPVRDLVPVCPNCHMMLHSKTDGVFSVDELKQLIKKRASV